MGKGERIRQLREALNMSQTELAAKIDVSKQTLYKYENNIVTNIPSDKIEAIAKALNTTPAHIMAWDDDAFTFDCDLKVELLPDEMPIVVELYRKYEKAPDEIKDAINSLLKLHKDKE